MEGRIWSWLNGFNQIVINVTKEVKAFFIIIFKILLRTLKIFINIKSILTVPAIFWTIFMHT